MALPLSFDITPESIVTSLGAAQALFFGGYILAARRHNRANVFLAGFMFAFATVWIGEILLSIGADPAYRYFILPIDALLAPLMYLYVTGLIEPRPGAAGTRRLLHLSAAGLVLALLIPWVLLPSELKTAPIGIDFGWQGLGAAHPWLASATPQVLTPQTAPAGLLVSVLCLLLVALLYQIQVTAYVGAMVVIYWRVRRQRRQVPSLADTSRLRWMGFICLWCVVIWVTVVPFNILYATLGFGPEENLLQEIAQLAIVYALGFAGVRHPMVYTPVHRKGPVPQHGAIDGASGLDQGPDDTPPKYARSGLSRVALNRIAEKLNRAMVDHELYLESSLTLPRLADRTGIPTNHISQVLNEHFGRNFFEFVNGFRVEAAKRDLRSSDKTVLDVALAAGFNSKSTFNAAFKKVVGQTPSQFRTAQVER